MTLKGLWAIASGLYTIGKELWDEIRREKAKQKALIASKEAAITKAVAHQRAQEAAAISHKVTVAVTVPTPSVVQLRPPRPPR